MKETLYNKIGREYNATRTADPYIAERMHVLLNPKTDGKYLDVGCGTGNYLLAFMKMGVDIYGVDPSEIMLAAARKKLSNERLIQAYVEYLPFEDNNFDGATAMFTFHHWKDKKQGLKEIHRVLKPSAPLIFLSFTGEQMRGYWLNHYFPKMMQRSWELVPELPEMEQWLNECGFTLTATEKYFVQDDLQDHFLYSNKRRPEQYLLPEIRANASSFSAFCDEEELQDGLQRLSRDIDNGEIREITRAYENSKGDYIFLKTHKKG